MRFLAGIVLACILAGLTTAASSAENPPSFLHDVKPILAQRCFRCHSSLEQESNLRLDSVPAILKGGDGGVVVVAGKVGDSRLLAAVRRTGDLKMPPEGEPLTEQQISTIQAWIEAGAPAPPPGAEAKVAHWSFQKPVRPELPKIVDAAWSANPIDRFVAAKHGELKLSPLGEAPPNLLLRRVYLDLTGLPPSTKELEDFVSQPAYEAAVDRLLTSPRYGERWGRHWMDVWRYSDWDGYGNEIRESKPHIWRWRDWIVESLNADKPYDRMVQEMLAADELAPSDPEALRATGYLVRSWYKFNRNKWMDDAIEHTGKAFLGVTFNCCRCHDHMYDPLAQKEYYALRAFFEPYDIRTDRVPGESNTDKSGLVRVFDAKPDEKTFLFVRGNEKDPRKDEPLSPTVPQVFASVPCSIETVQLPPASAYPGLAEFVRSETLAAARRDLETAKSTLAEAEKKFADAVASGGHEPTDQSNPAPPTPPRELADADNQLALAQATLAAAEANLAFQQARLSADDANYASPPAANAKELSLSAGQVERTFNLLQSTKAVVQAEINLTAASRAKKEGDAKTTKAVTDAEAALKNAFKARSDAVAAAEKPSENYTRLTSTYPATSTGRRLALARWITSKENPLAARVAINHIWLRHFGTPLVPSVFDFGLNGKPPTNQPLLDWLAVELMENGWQMKHIHKLIVTSRTYKLASSAGQMTNDQEPITKRALNTKHETPNTVLDPENLYYWRANPRRMEAEAVRDATLFVAGSLDETRGGPDLDPNQGLTVPRRSLYFRTSKEKKMQFLAMFDSPNPVECYRRTESIAPQQALALANSTLSLAQSRVLGKKLSDSLAATAPKEAPRQFVSRAFVGILCREPTPDEMSTCLEFLAEQSKQLADPNSLTAFSSGPAASVQPSADPQQRARENLVHVLFNHNDFVTVR